MFCCFDFYVFYFYFRFLFLFYDLKNLKKKTETIAPCHLAPWLLRPLSPLEPPWHPCPPCQTCSLKLGRRTRDACTTSTCFRMDFNLYFRNKKGTVKFEHCHHDGHPLPSWWQHIAIMMATHGHHDGNPLPSWWQPIAIMMATHCHHDGSLLPSWLQFPSPH